MRKVELLWMPHDFDPDFDPDRTRTLKDAQGIFFLPFFCLTKSVYHVIVPPILSKQTLSIIVRLVLGGSLEGVLKTIFRET